VSRDARTGPGRDRSPAGRTTGSARRSPAATRAGASGSGRAPSRSREADRLPGSAGGDGLVVGTVPVGARIAGALLVLSALAGVAALFPSYLVVGGQDLRSATGLGGILSALLVPGAELAVGVVLLRGLVPKFGLAFAAVAGALSLGLLLIEIYRGSGSTAHPGVEVIAGQRLVTTSVAVAPGWVIGVVGLTLTVLAGAWAVLAWGRTVMDDGGALDPVRSVLAGAAVLLGVLTVLCLSVPASDVPDQLVTDPTTGMETVVTREGPVALLERPGLALLGGLLLAGAVVLCSVIAPSLRPRLAAVGGLLAIAVVVLAAALTGIRDAAGSDDLEWTLPGAGLLLAGLAYAGLTVVAWRARRSA
jgi:hypothetical protein